MWQVTAAPPSSCQIDITMCWLTVAHGCLLPAHGSPMDLMWVSRGDSVGFPWVFHGSPMRLPCDTHITFTSQIASRGPDGVRVAWPGLARRYLNTPDPTGLDSCHLQPFLTRPDSTREFVKFLLVRPAGRVMTHEKP